MSKDRHENTSTGRVFSQNLFLGIQFQCEFDKSLFNQTAEHIYSNTISVHLTDCQRNPPQRDALKDPFIREAEENLHLSL